MFGRVVDRNLRRITMATIKETIEQIKKVGIDDVRVVPSTPGRSNIQIYKDGNWKTILENVNTMAVDDILRQATNKVILG